MSIQHQIQDHFISLVKRSSLGHAYIFFGPDGGKKLQFAKGLAAYLETKSWPEEPELRPARGEARQGRPLTDAQVFASVEGTIGIDVSRAIREFLGSSPLRSSRRTAIIESAAKMTSEAQNALLKIAEEPPETALLILILRDPEALRPTLISRFQKIYFGVNEKEERVKKGGEEEGRALAKEFLAVAPGGRKEFLKELVVPDEFSLTDFLDHLIYVLSTEKTKRASLWHAVLELRRAADTAPLNPKLQLLSLWTHI